MFIHVLRPKPSPTLPFLSNIVHIQLINRREMTHLAKPLLNLGINDLDMGDLGTEEETSYLHIIMYIDGKHACQRKKKAN